MNEKKGRENWIDLCKIISTLLVIFLHTINIGIATNKKNFALLFYNIGVFAVPLFFMVNGYLQLGRIKNYKYAFKKIINILFVCFIWNVPIFLAQILIKKETPNIFINVLNNFRQDGFFFQFWFLGALILIYLFLPLLQKIFSTKKLYKYITFFLFICCISIDFINILNCQFGHEIIKNKIYQVFRLWTWLFYFFAGGLVKKDDTLKKINKNNLIIITLVMIIVSILYEYFFAYYLYSDMYAENFYDSLLICITTFLIFNLFKRINIKNSYIAFFGSLMMGVYIIHPTLIRIFRKMGVMNNDYFNIIWALIIFLISVFISYVISKIPIIKKAIKI